MIKVTNPYNGELVGEVEEFTESMIAERIDRAYEAQKEWKKVPVYKKVDLSLKFLELVKEHREELKSLLSAESGKNYSEVEIEMNNIFTSWRAFGEKIKHLYDQVIPAGREMGHDKNIVITKREPLGVIAAIIPFNFPTNLFNQKVAPSLLAGNAVIVKPASTNPLTVIRLVELLHEAGFPKDIVTVVTGNGSKVGKYLCTNDKISLISLTGSTEVGVEVAKMAAEGLKDTALELGGNDAFVVLEDADVDLAIAEAAGGRFFNAGQICCAPKRFIVHSSLYEKFIEGVSEKVSKIKSGELSDPETKIGTLISENAAKTVGEQINKTISEGGKLILGGKRNRAFIEPTVIRDVPHTASIMHDMEVFGPVMPITSFETEEEALELANDSIYGLGASVFTKDMKTAMRFTEEFESGTVVINGSSYFRSFEMPFGGAKMSGIGVEGVYSTFDEVTRLKCVVLKSIY
ncbi:MAG: aldehyde dehydrogenase family protein [Lachnospiraceae bacterium]|nr:aldehyde dehydrogenase family protein [Lachnospiraceae bacterium]